MSDAVTYWIVKGTFGLLVLFSAVTWTVVVAKAVEHWRLSRQNAGFARAFGALATLPAVEAVKKESGPAARVALAGLDAWYETASAGSHAAELEVRRDVLERGLRRQIQRERRHAEGGLGVLASIGSTSPFVGLFGTVLGIIHALTRISSLGSASLDVVAGPIGEALVATGIGIAVAVPAVLAFNFFSRKLKGLGADLEDLASGFVNRAITGDVAESPSGDGNAKRSSLQVRREATA